MTGIDDRPDPDELLSRYGFVGSAASNGRGKLRIYLGAAPGVGKTYAMLGEGHRLRRDGIDAVIGLVETHGRRETEAQIGDLEVVQPRVVQYGGIDITEMDVDAILARKPDVVLVDELAHTNAPGSVREKRWQDVEVLRDVGIDVISTLNIQHIESLNHVVESITGVAVRETVPDDVLTGATEVQLVDLPVEGLLERLHTGKVYPPDRARQALEHFFRPGNLTALRELALRQTAAEVDEKLERYMHDHQIAEVWPAAERVAVLLDERPAGALIRAGWRLASVMRSDLIAFIVRPSDVGGKINPERRTALERNLHLAEDLGAIPRELSGDDAANAIAEFLRAENINFLVVDHDAAKPSRRLFGKSLVDQLFERVDNVHIQLVETVEKGRRS